LTLAQGRGGEYDGAIIVFAKKGDGPSILHFCSSLRLHQLTKKMDPNFNTEAFSLLGVSLAVISLRVSTRTAFLGYRNLQPDDYLMVLAGVSNKDFNLEKLFQQI
jgi:hypothetical protein